VDAGGAVLVILLFAVLGAAGVATFVFWIMKVVEVAQLPEHQYQAAGTEKLPWVLVVVLAGIVGALVWQFAKRKDVLGAAGRFPAPPPGWYPEPGGQALRWWDGAQWTDQRLAPPGPV
jgi:hypothetical protein